jgi:MHS family proline/betaine transporter-like MFS transporter
MVAITETDARAGVRIRQNIGAALVGNMLEWYDFAVYGFMVAIIGKAFFPATDPLSSLLLSFAVFGVGFLGRPIGSIAIGWLGDVRGRKPALVITILTMAVSTVLIGIIPSYATIGVAAPILVVIARLLQGFSTGGEVGNVMAFMVEWAPGDRRGLYGGLQQCSSATGFLLGSGVAAATASLLPIEAMEGWGWRIPFLLGGIIGPVGAYLRCNCDETPAFRQVQSNPAITTGGATAFWLTARGFGFPILWAVSYYTFVVFMPSFTKTAGKLTASEALWSNTVGLIALVIFAPLMGRLSDRVGRKPILLTGCVLFLLLTYPAFSLVASGISLPAVMALQFGLGFLLSIICGVSPTAISEIFPTHNRTTWMSIGYTLSVTIFGGFAPFIATWLTKESGSPIAPTFYVMVAAVISFVVIARLPETAHRPLD